MTAFRPGEFTDQATPPATTPRPIGQTVRPLEARDLEEVADVFLRVFRGMASRERRAAALPEVTDYLRRLYLEAPWHRPDDGSLVCRKPDGAFAGLMGSVEMHLSIGGRRLKASALGTFMIADPDRDSQAAVTLLRHHLGNGLPIHFTDTANRISLEFTRPLRFEVLPLHSLEWVFPLRPASLVLSRAKRRFPRLPFGLGAPLARGLDAPLRRIASGATGFGDGLVIDEMERADFLTAAPADVAERRLQPDWSGEELGWLLDRAAERLGNGPLRIRRARDARGRDVGFWLVWAEAGGIAAVLQAFGPLAGRRALVRAILADAEAMGCVAVRGTTDPTLMEALYAVPGVLFHHKGATCVRARDPDVREALRAGDVAIGGLTGESWTRLVSDRF
jgi:hypothetical protein